MHLCEPGTSDTKCAAVVVDNIGGETERSTVDIPRLGFYETEPNQPA